MSNSHDQNIETLKRQYQETGDDRILTELRDMRLNSGEKLTESTEGASRPKIRPAVNPFPDVEKDIPEIDYSELTPKILRGAIQHHGALLVRNFMPKTRTKFFRDGIDHAFDESKEYLANFNKNRKPDAEFSPWFQMKMPGEGYFKNDDVSFMVQTGSVWTFLSPAVSHHLLDFFDDANLRGKLDEYFESRTCLSFNKSVLRRMTPLKGPADWHQDGSFMTENIKSINLWVALSECGKGTDCPGMDFVPRRLKKIVKTGVNGARYDWSVSYKSVHEWFPERPPVRPYFDEGDAIFFDHYNLHVTSYSEEYTRRRYALETWFFSEDYPAKNQHPAIW